VARAAVPGRLISGPRPWRVATIKAATDETATARTLVVDVPGWPGHLPGQHADVRLTAEDGYSAQRSYSIASAPEPDRLEFTVQRLDDGEVSRYLAGIAEPGDQFDLRGPIGGWFTWSPESAQPRAHPKPLLLLAGGSGVVPLMSMIRAHGAAKSEVPVGLIYSVRSPPDVIYASELSERTLSSPLSLTLLYTRSAHRGVPPGRINAAVIAASAFPPDTAPDIYVCGPSGFVEAATSLLVEAGHPPPSIKTERFGPTGTVLSPLAAGRFKPVPSLVARPKPPRSSVQAPARRLTRGGGLPLRRAA
jgi:ferredoxin-NADP reductase